MRERLDDIARAGISLVGGFFASVYGLIMGWVQGGDRTLFLVLGVLALVLLFVLVPNRRRY